MDDFMIVDKTFGSIQTLLGITSGYGYSTNFEERLTDSSHTSELIDTIKRIEKAQESLNQTLILIKKFEINELNQSNGLLKQAEIFSTDSRLTKLIGELKDTLHFLNNNFAKIIGTLDKPQQDEANRIEMNIKYQKILCNSLHYDKNLLGKFNENLTTVKELANSLNLLNRGDMEMGKFEIQARRLVEKLKQCMEQILDLLSKYNKQA